MPSSLASRLKSMTSSQRPHTIHFPVARLAAVKAELDRAELERTGDRGKHHARSAAPASSSQAADYSMDVSLKHRMDNRWSDILTYDHSLLPGDYLNAALIPPYPSDEASPSSKRSYIASQAPLPHTLATFYDHVIQQGVRLIVNLTPFTERGRNKADEYWPLQAGTELRIEADPGASSSSTTKYVVRQSDAPVLCDKTLRATRYALSIADATRDNQPPSDLVVLHVTAWADFGVFPEDVFDTLLRLIEQEDDAGRPPKSPPIWVHCSAGVGRSGTVISSLLARDLGPSIEEALRLNVGEPRTPASLTNPSLLGAQKLIDHARQYRPRMVETDEQVAMVAAVVGARLQKRSEL